MGWLVLLLIGQFVINEVMYNPLGHESGSGSPGDCNEFIEILNASDDTLDISGFFIGDDDELDSIVVFGDSTILEHYPGVLLDTKIPPHSYALILDPEYTSPYSQVKLPYDIPPGTRIFSPEDSDIGNGLSSTDPIFLISPSHDTVSLDTSKIETPDGYSRERRGPQFTLFLVSRFGSTPGRINSWSYQVNVAFQDTFYLLPDNPEPGEPFELRLFILNIGLEPVEGFSIILDAEDLYDSIPYILTIEPLDTEDVDISLPPLPEGLNRILLDLVLDEDDDTVGNSMTLTIPVGRSPLIINEIMYDEPEWIELFNKSDESIELQNFSVEDASGRRAEFEGTFHIEGGEYMVLTGDSGFMDRFPGIPFIYLSGFPTLNNASETVYLKSGESTLEKVSYRGSWGGGEGVSLERVSPELPSNERSNWRSSRDPQGATPGRENSVRAKLKGGGILKLSKRVFNPESEPLLIEIDINDLEEAKLYILDSTGRILKILKGRDRVFEFDGKDERGYLLGTGLYIVYVEAKGGGRLHKEKRTFIIRRTP